MIVLQVLLLLSAVYGLWVSFLNLRHSQAAYEDWRQGEDNGLGLQVASHHVRIAVTNVVIESSALIIAVIILSVMWLKRFDLDLTLILFVGVVVPSILNLMKQLMYRYDRALIIDVAKSKKKAAAQLREIAERGAP